MKAAGGGCRGMESEHDESCAYESREKLGAGKTGGAKNRGTSRGLLASQGRGEFRLRTRADKFLLKSMDY